MKSDCSKYNKKTSFFMNTYFILYIFQLCVEKRRQKGIKNEKLSSIKEFSLKRYDCFKFRDFSRIFPNFPKLSLFLIDFLNFLRILYKISTFSLFF